MIDIRNWVTKDITKSELKKKPPFVHVSEYNNDTGDFDVQIGNTLYTYAGGSPHLVDKLRFRAKKTPGKTLQQIKNTYKLRNKREL